jgi:hypothetical protein
MVRKSLALFSFTLIDSFITFLTNAAATTVTKEGLSIKLDKGTLAVDVKDVDVKLVFKALKVS